jgi:hypothetical protein
VLIQKKYPNDLNIFLVFNALRIDIYLVDVLYHRSYDIMTNNNNNNKQIRWFNDFIGVGYRYYDIYMNVFPMFEDRMYAFKLWKKTIEWWSDDQIKLRFIEGDSNYWFILYGGSEYKDDNTGFVKNVPISENYQRFKEGCENKAILRFGIYKENIKNKKANDEKFALELLKKSKSVYDLKFLQYSDLEFDSIEWDCICRNKSDINAQKV